MSPLYWGIQSLRRGCSAVELSYNDKYPTEYQKQEATNRSLDYIRRFLEATNSAMSQYSIQVAQAKLERLQNERAFLAKINEESDFLEMYDQILIPNAQRNLRTIQNKNNWAQIETGGGGSSW